MMEHLHFYDNFCFLFLFIIPDTSPPKYVLSDVSQTLIEVGQFIQ